MIKNVKIIMQFNENTSASGDFAAPGPRWGTSVPRPPYKSLSTLLPTSVGWRRHWWSRQLPSTGSDYVLPLRPVLYFYASVGESRDGLETVPR